MSKVCWALMLGFTNLPGMAAEVVPDRSPAEWLEFMNQAFVNSSYDGLFSYFDGTDLSTLRVVHAVVDGVQRERLVHLNGERREIIRRGNDVACILQPGDEMLALEGSIPSGPFARAFSRAFGDVDGNYELTNQGTDRVADRTAVIIHVAPRDRDRYGYRLWLDRDNGLLLRSELVDTAGARLEIFQFAKVAIDEPIPASALQPETHDGAITSHLSLEEKPRPNSAHTMRWRADWIPAGFRMAAWDIRRTPATMQSVSTLMYSDGLAAFSVFVEVLPAAGAARLVSRNGATVAVTHMAHGPNDAPHLVTVVGEVPVATAQRIARSVSYVSSE